MLRQARVSVRGYRRDARGKVESMRTGIMVSA